jgi:hypothetical protein
MKNKGCRHSRRKFLKISAAGTAGAVISGIAANRVSAAVKAEAARAAWQDGMQINPFIENTRVVFCHDPSMVTTTPTSWSLQNQNDNVDNEKIVENMDKMAMALAQKAGATEAWDAIFQKPQGKEWSETMVAIKPNCRGDRGVPKISIIKKFCDELNRLGVPYENMIIYDATHFDCISTYGTSYCLARLPSGVQISDTLGPNPVRNDPALVTLPDGETDPCAPWLADGTIDLLVNIGVNKGHDNTFTGKFTLAAKNHFGSIRCTQEWDTHPENDTMMSKIVAINKCKEILGEGLPPRQQICFIDSIWAMTDGPRSTPNRRPDCLIMGTFAPVLDYLIVKKIREEPQESQGGQPWGMGIDDTVEQWLNQLVSDFGYPPDQEPLASLEFVDAMSYVPAELPDITVQPADLTLHMSGPARPSQITFPLTGGPLPDIAIYNTRGKLIRTLAVPRMRENISIVWDGKNEKGGKVASGTYVVKLVMGKKVSSRRITVM